ncbi:RNA polymerase sigma factor [Virgisporangium aliadipatigenens]|uniref:RNA polymerase sigma factor n=1 Tax=Virgisporangium aliadipatigenens TaxID=741659 RepID=UPI001EF168AC|nr:RNA polymerase sigma factor [Virgisporangium aliadipatigenens]
MRDEDLSTALTAAVRGSDAGFTTLWRALNPAVLRYLRVVCGEAAEDVASETWLQVARALPGFTGDATTFRVWLFRVARHRGIDDGRRAWRKREQARESVEPVDGRAERDVLFDVIENSGTEWALSLIGTLPPDQAEAVLLRVVAGLDAAGAAQVLGKRAGAVRIAAMRGLRRLAAHPQVRDRRAAAGPPRPRGELRLEGNRTDGRA